MAIGRGEAKRGAGNFLIGFGLIAAMLIAGAVQGDPWKFRERTGSGPHLFRLPVENPGGKLFSGTRLDFPLGLVGLDHQPHPDKNIIQRAICHDYLGRGFPHCYANHLGSDFILKGGFKAMDAEQGRVVAAADGAVTRVEDGHYDRCRMSIAKMDVSCQGHEMKPNFVEILHPSGYRTIYYHLKKGSIAVQPGQPVKCGDFLGNVGSSGVSSMPHLHFQVMAPDGLAVDPFSKNPADSLWVKPDGPNGLPEEKCAP